MTTLRSINQTLQAITRDLAQLLGAAGAHRAAPSHASTGGAAPTGGGPPVGRG